MSRIGKTSIEIPTGVKIEKVKNSVEVTGPKGNLSLGIPHGFEVDIVEGKADIRLTGTDPKLNSLHGLIRSLLANYVIGVTKGWEKTVELIGVGYKAVGGGAEVILSVGFTHPVKITTPDKNTSFKITDNTKITVTGIDKKLVGEIAAQIRAVKPPEPYKGKGIRYLGEVVRKKAGKAVKAAGAGA